MSVVDVTEAAALFGVTPQRVGQLCRIGRMKCQKVDHKWYVPLGEIERFKNTRTNGRPRGRPGRFYDGRSLARRRAKVRKMLAEGLSVAEIAERLDVDTSTIYRDKAIN